MSKDLFENLVTDITAQVLQQVQQQLNVNVVNVVNERLPSLVSETHVQRVLEERINAAVVSFQPDMSVVEKNIQTLTNQWATSISADLSSRTEKILEQKINSIDINGLVLGAIKANLDPDRQSYPFPEKSIDAKSVNTENLTVTGDQVVGGVIKNFGSTGIDDQATECKVTILDQGTVFENTLYAPKIEIKGGAVIDGDLVILGKIVDSEAYRQIVNDVAFKAQTNLTDDVLQQYQDTIFNRIRQEGIDLSKVTFDGRVLIEDKRLVGVVDSQLRTVGVLQDLQTRGDTFLSDTVFIAGKRLGVNTMDPKSAVSVWDEEVEFSIGKHKQGVGRISVERATELVMGSNGNDNVTMSPDGTTKIPKLKINNMMFTTSATPPHYEAMKGTVVFNENPTLGGPLGWVSLGDARWANFGIID